MGLFKRPSRLVQAPGLCRRNTCNNSERSSSRRFIKHSGLEAEAPCQLLGRRTLASLLGHRELQSGHFWLSLISECISCYLYVFIVCSTRISWTGSLLGHEPNLLAMSLSSGIAMMLLLLTFRTVHVNPALTLSFLLTGRIPLIRALCYLLVHCLGSVAAIAFLYSISVRGHAGSLGLDNPHEALAAWQVTIVEVVISFVVTLATYATCNYSSYAQAKQHVLEQLGRTNLIDLFPPNTNNHSCDTSSSSRPSANNSATIAPLVPQMPITSITLKHGGGGGDVATRTAGVAPSDLMNVANGQQNNEQQQQQTNGSNTSYTNDNLNTNKPYLISNHYNQVYDQCNDVMVDDNNMAPEKSDSNQGQQHQLDSGNPAARIQMPYSNDDLVSGHQQLRPSIFAHHTMKNNSIHPTPPSFNGIHQQTKDYLFPQTDDNRNYDYEYDNHRIYATQQRPKFLLDSSPSSSSSPQVPLEEIMEDECQLLAPNGFSLNVTTGQALVIGLAYTLTSLTGIPASGASLNPARSFGPAFIMNQWDGHWMYWAGPILGAVIAGFFYEFVFNPTRESSLCYRPKLFRFSAQDMAEVGSKSRLYQQRLNSQHHNHHHQQHNHHHHSHHNINTNHHHHQPSSSTSLYKPQAHLLLQQQQQQQQLLNHQSSSIHHQHSPTSSTSRVMTANGNNLISNSSLLRASRGASIAAANSNGLAATSLLNSHTTSTSVSHLQQRYYKQMFAAAASTDQVLYDDPTLEPTTRAQTNARRPPSLAYLPNGHHQQQRFGGPGRLETQTAARPRSMASFRQPGWVQEEERELDDDLYNVLSETRDDDGLSQVVNGLGIGKGNGNDNGPSNGAIGQQQQQPPNAALDFDYANQLARTTTDSSSDSSQRTREMLPPPPPLPVLPAGDLCLSSHHHHHQNRC